MPKLLIVEDEEAFRQFITLALNLEGYDVRSANNGEQALTALRDVPPDLVVLDLSLPHISGWDVLHFMRGDPQLKDTPVLVLTANADAETRRRSVEEGVHRLLVKPVGLDDILDAIRDSIQTP